MEAPDEAYRQRTKRTGKRSTTVQRYNALVGEIRTRTLERLDEAVRCSHESTSPNRRTDRRAHTRQRADAQGHQHAAH